MSLVSRSVPAPRRIFTHAAMAVKTKVWLKWNSVKNPCWFPNKDGPEDSADYLWWRSACRADKENVKSLLKRLKFSQNWEALRTAWNEPQSRFRRIAGVCKHARPSNDSVKQWADVEICLSSMHDILTADFVMVRVIDKFVPNLQSPKQQHLWVQVVLYPATDECGPPVHG